MSVRSICPVDVSGIQRKLACAPEDLWQRRTNRKVHHPDTRYVALYWPTGVDEGGAWVSEWTDEYSLFCEELEPILDLIETRYDSDIARVLLTAIYPDGKIAPHQDVDPQELRNHRLHVPIVTDTSAVFITDGTSHHLQEGMLYEIDINAEHSVENHWDFRRIHLVVDVKRKP